jgi:hypothetical protein
MLEGSFRSPMHLRKAGNQEGRNGRRALCVLIFILIFIERVEGVEA